MSMFRISRLLPIPSAPDRAQAQRRLSPGLRLTCAGLLLLSFLQAAPLPLQAAEDQITLNFVNADIDTVTKAVAQITGKTFIVDPRVKGTVNVVSNRPVPQALAYHYLLSALRMQGFAAVENRGVVRILPEADAKTHGGPTRKGAQTAQGDQLVTRVFHLQHESASNMVPAIRPLVAPNNPVSANPGSNSLVITDYADNLARLAVIIAALDTPYSAEPQLIPVRHASAIDLAATLNRVFSDEAPAGRNDVTRRLSIQADPRSNSLIVRSDNPSQLAHIRSLLAALDQPTAAGGNIHVVYLKNAEAKKIAQTLQAVTNAKSTAYSTGTPTAGADTSTPKTATLATADTQSNGYIQADETSNALIITAPEPIYNNLRRVIDLLDKRRAQVLVEALIVELTSDRAHELGVQWLAGDVASNGKTAVIGSSSFGSGSKNMTGLIESLAKAKSTGTLGLAPGLNLGVLSNPAGMGVLIRALENDANANILSTPNLLTLDNEEAKIVIGSNVPFISGQYAATGNSVTATPFQTYERKDVGLMLKIKPQISEGGLVRLQIYQEASSIQDNTLSNTAGPSTNKRSIETSVVVDDGATIVIGGLIQDNFGAGEDKVPLLGDIPFIGSAFRYETRKRMKTNLMVFLRPHIVRDAVGSERLTIDRYDYIIGEQQKAAQGIDLMRGETAAPQLPARSPASATVADKHQKNPPSPAVEQTAATAVTDNPADSATAQEASPAAETQPATAETSQTATPVRNSWQLAE